jgi:transposase-like protein
VWKDESHVKRSNTGEADDASVLAGGEGSGGAARVPAPEGDRDVAGVADQLGYGAESVRRWVAQAEIDGGGAAGVSTTDRARMKTLEQENKELRRANEILKSASAFFAAELDRPQK